MAPRDPRLWADRPQRRPIGRARRGLDTTIRHLRGSERISPVDEAAVALCRVLADELDQAAADTDESRFVRARVAAAYRESLVMLYGMTAPTDADDDLDALLAGLLHAPDAGTPD